jgi:acetylornithine deacetylase/succinyl-diaminopimelate desuccinylase-like protein
MDCLGFGQPKQGNSCATPTGRKQAAIDPTRPGDMIPDCPLAACSAMAVACRHRGLIKGLWMAVSNRFVASLCGLIFVGLAGTPPVRAADDAIADATILAAAQKSFPEFFELLALPNDAVNAADIVKNADWLVDAFRKRGFAARQLANKGKPLVFAEFSAKRPDAKTILFYMHFDGQPVIAAQWAQASPWQAALKRRAAEGKWQEFDRNALKGEIVDPEWRLFARSASDDKGPIMMFLTAFDILKAMGAAPAFNVKVLLDSEEEKGSLNIGIAASENCDLLRADAIVIHDGPMHESGRPTIVYGNRGNTLVVLTVYGPTSNLHSGHYGNYVPNPAQRLAALLATMKDDSGRVTVAGYYDGVKISDADRKIMAEVPDDPAAIARRVGIAKPEAVGRNYQEALQYPSLNIRGMAAAAIGEKAANIVPSHAIAELDLRTTPGADPAYLVEALEQHIAAQGYHLVRGEPSAQERATYDKLASLKEGRGSKAAYTPMDSVLGAWAQATLARTFAAPPRSPSPASRGGGEDSGKTVRIRMMGGSVPTDKLVDALDLPFVIIPLVNGDNNQHSFDENIRIGHYLAGIRAFTGLLRSPY